MREKLLPREAAPRFSVAARRLENSGRTQLHPKREGPRSRGPPTGRKEELRSGRGRGHRGGRLRGRRRRGRLGHGGRRHGGGGFLNYGRGLGRRGLGGRGRLLLLGATGEEHRPEHGCDDQGQKLLHLPLSFSLLANFSCETASKPAGKAS